MLSITERPTSLDDFIGHDSVVKSIRSQLDSPGCPHVFMFTGPSGVGKTTLARIVAQMLGGFGLGIQEINVSNETGVDAARKLIQDSQMNPMEGTKLIYILDEVDKASDSWQSVMKKPLEDTPSRTYYVLCTEFPNKVKKALHTRSAVYALNPFSDEDMMYLLKKTIRKIDKEVSMEILSAITEHSEGSPRQGLVLLQQVMDSESVGDALEIISSEGAAPEVIELCRALLNEAPWKTVAGILKDVRADAEGTRRQILGYANAVLLRSGKSHAFAIIDVFKESLFASGKPGLTAMCFEISS